MQTAHFPQALSICRGWWVGAALAPLLFVGGCATNTQTGALAGAGIGGAAGALIGSAAHVPVAGAVIGAAAGTMIGASAGASADEAERRKAVQQEVAARGGPLSLEQIRDMVHNNVGDAVIMDQIRLTRTVFQLTPEQITWLHTEGVSDAVIQYMQRSGYVPRRVVYVEQPTPVVGVGFGFRRGW